MSVVSTVSVADALRSTLADLDGELLLAGDPGWDAARGAWQLTAEQRPAGVVLAASEADVVAAVRAARELGLSIAPQLTGHGALAVRSLDRSLLIRTTALSRVVVNPDARTVTVGAGVTWGAVTAAVAPLGLAALAGSSPSVGVVGYTLGGGLGWLGRAHGLAAGSLLAARVVTPDGRVVETSESAFPDLWWTLRGGGGVGVVTEVTLRLFEVPRVAAGSLWFPVEDARRVLHAWRRWLPTAPREITTVGRILRLPNIPELPAPIRGGSFVLIQVASIDPAHVDEAIAALRALGPVIDDIAVGDASALADLAMDPPTPSAGAAEGLLLAELSESALDAWIDVAFSEVGARVVALDIRHLGGALADRSVPGAMTWLDGEVAVVAVSPVTPATDLDEAQHAVASALGAVGSWASVRAYGNFAERTTADERLFGDARARLEATRASLDPDRVMRGRHR